MQPNEQVLKRRVKIDGTELAGLISCSDVKDEEGTVEAPRPGRIIVIKNGMKKLDPVTLEYTVKRGTNTHDTLLNWFQNDETHDVLIEDTDADGDEVHSWLLRDCEMMSFAEPPYNALAPELFKVTCVINCTQKPTKIPAA